MRTDPIFTVIAKHRKLKKQSFQAYDAVDVAQGKVAKKHGHRPLPLVHWRNYTICGREIDHRCAVLLEPKWLKELGVTRKQIKKEYREKKAEERAKIKAGKAWDKLHGIAHLRRENERALQAWHDGGIQLSKTKPTTPAGAGALLKYLRADMEAGECYWHFPALETVAAALARM